jgi:hypothetical protein
MFRPVTVGAGLLFVCAAAFAFVTSSEAVRAEPLATPLLMLPPRPAGAIGGAEFARRTSSLSSSERDRAVVAELERGNIPSFLGHLTPVKLTAKPFEHAPAATIWVAPDYLAIGSDDDFLYVPLNYYSATVVADYFGCILPTARMVDAIYEQSAHHLTPAPLPAGPLMRSNLYLEKHQQRIDAQRSGLPLGDLISGHKKDLVLSNALFQTPGRVAIYGWHRAASDPIQPLSTVHGARYVDYSHGVRLVSTTVLVNGRARSIYDARLSDVEMQERQPRRETRASVAAERSQKPGFPTHRLCGSCGAGTAVSVAPWFKANTGSATKARTVQRPRGF